MTTKTKQKTSAQFTPDKEELIELFKYWTTARLSEPNRWDAATTRANAIRTVIGNDAANAAAERAIDEYFAKNGSREAYEFRAFVWNMYRRDQNSGPAPQHRRRSAAELIDDDIPF